MAKRFVPLFGLFVALGMGVLPLRAQTIDSSPLAPPPDVVTTLSAAMAKAFASPDYQAGLK